MAEMPKTIEAELILRYPSGKETKLGSVEIELHARYAFSFEKRTDQPITPPTVTDSLARIEGASK